MHPSSSPKRRSGTRGVLPSAIFITLLMATSVQALSSAPRRASASGAAPTTAPAPVATHAWSKAQVAELIAEIAASREAGLDPDDYGIAALRGQLVLAAEVLGTDGSSQLDILADTAALSLARDYRSGVSPIGVGVELPAPSAADRAALRNALRSGTLRSWLQAQKRARMPQSRRPAAASGV